MKNLLPKLAQGLGGGTQENSPKLKTIEFCSTEMDSFGICLEEIFAQKWTPNIFQEFLLRNFVVSIIRGNRKTVRVLRLNASVEKTFMKFYAHPACDQIMEIEHSDLSWNIGSNPDWIKFLTTQVRYLSKLSLTGSCIAENWGSLKSILENNRHTLKMVTIRVKSAWDYENIPRDAANFDLSGLSMVILAHFEILIADELNFLTKPFKMQPLVQISEFPRTLRILKLSTPIKLPNRRGPNFSSNLFGNLANLEIFEFSAVPWFYFGGRYEEGESCYYLDGPILKNMIDWLPNLKNLNLRSRLWKDLSTVPDSALEWMLFCEGISLEKVIPKEIFELEVLGKYSNSEYFVNISIEPIYRKEPNKPYRTLFN